MESVAAVIIIGVISAIGFVAHYNSERQRMKRALRDAPLRSIAEVADGELVKLIGKVAFAEEPIEAPLSGRACAYFRAKVIRDGKHPETLVEETKWSRSLWVEDESGRALVEMTLPTVVLTMDNKTTSGVLDEPDARQKAYLREHHQPATGWIFNKSLIYEEGVLEAGEEIVVFGRCAMEIDPDPRPGGEGNYRESPMRARIVAPLGAELWLSDDIRLLRAASKESVKR